MITLFNCTKTSKASLYNGNVSAMLSEQGETLILCVKGKTYADKKAFLRDLAIQYSWFDCDGLSYGELAEINAFFERNGKRYGLLEEFRENAIV